MCGITGWYGSNADEGVVARMVDALRARGPDGTVVRRVSTACVLGHTRLAIVDPSDAGQQPMSDASGNVWAVVNGEIYNHRSLRRELEARGIRFRSQCDSEVVVQGFAIWGRGVIDRLRGIFALAIVDTNTGEVLIARDRAGVKPLYYTLQDGQLVFASELKGLRASARVRLDYDPCSMHSFLARRYLPAPLTPYRGVFKLEAGHLLAFADGRCTVMPYWAPTLIDDGRGFDDAADALAGDLVDAVSAQLMSDAPVGLLLSGGIDSSSIAALATRDGRPMHAFCCGFEEASHDERPFARTAADATGVELHEMVMTWPLLLRRMADFCEWFDEPFFNYSAIAIHELSRMARQRGIKVLLAGEGADELFAGYLWYDDFATHAGGSDDAALERFFAYVGLFSAPMQEALAGRRLGLDHLDFLRRIDRPDLSPVSRAQWLDFHSFLPDDVLCRDDRASMAAGVELRVPYLDDRLLTHNFLLSQSLVYRSGERKHLLKRALERHLPQSVLTNRKKGFGFPLLAWQRQIRVLATRLLDNGSLIEWGYASRTGIQQVLQQPNINLVWLLITAELWMRRYLAGEHIPTLLDEAT